MATSRTVSKAKKRTASTKTARTTRAKQIIESKELIVPTHDQIAARAYEIWIGNGCPEGQDLVYWHEAEAKLTIGC